MFSADVVLPARLRMSFQIRHRLGYLIHLDSDQCYRHSLSQPAELWPPKMLALTTTSLRCSRSPKYRHSTGTLSRKGRRNQFAIPLRPVIVEFRPVSDRSVFRSFLWNCRTVKRGHGISESATLRECPWPMLRLSGKASNQNAKERDQRNGGRRISRK